MSSSLSWEPPPEETTRHYLDLKYEIGQYFEEDYNGGNGTWEVDNSFIPFLKGLIAGGQPQIKRDAQELICAIVKYGKVILMIS